MSTWVFARNREAGFKDYAIAGEIADYFSELIAPYPYEKLANVQSKTKYGGMENASCIFYAENSVTGNQTVNELIAHEIAHQWFGNTATEADWQHVWLSEGFATFLTAVYIEHKSGHEAYLRAMDLQKREVLKHYRKHPDSYVVDSTSLNLKKLLNPNVYERGSWVLYMLRNRLGEENFWKGIREYYQKFKFKNAYTRDLKECLEHVSGVQLDTFFNYWVFGNEIPTARGRWDYSSEKNILHITFDQETYQISPRGLKVVITLTDVEGKTEQISSTLGPTKKELIFYPKIAVDKLHVTTSKPTLCDLKWRQSAD